MSRGILLLIGLLAAVLIPVLLGGGETWSRLRSFPLNWLLIMFGMILLCWGINTLRLRLLLGDQREKVAPLKSLGVVMAAEVAQTFGEEPPTHVFAQAGVGALAAATPTHDCWQAS